MNKDDLEKLVDTLTEEDFDEVLNGRSWDQTIEDAFRDKEASVYDAIQYEMADIIKQYENAELEDEKKQTSFWDKSNYDIDKKIDSKPDTEPKCSHQWYVYYGLNGSGEERCKICDCLKSNAS